MLLDFKIITQNEFRISVQRLPRPISVSVWHGARLVVPSRLVLLGEGLPSDIRNDLETALFETPVDNVIPSSDERKEIIYMQYTNYVIAATKEKTHDTFRYKMLKKGSKSVMQY
ncbi:hypothetical protein BASA61_001820 [Batrachochytrium salamandrivorans]|nr:hypothetical protein BASA61_001820 [Batrachochytrium salamandrivorans]